MVNGNSVILQIGKESTYGTVVAGSEQIKISSESAKEVYNKADEGLATGGKGAGLKATMGIGVEGSFATLFRPDMGNILKGVLGAETATSGTEGYVHTFTAIGNAETDHLPAWTVYVDRKVGKFSYAGCKFGSLNLSASAGGYLTAEVGFNGKCEASGANLATLTPSTLKAFKFAQGKIYSKSGAGAYTEIADVKSMALSINNNLDAQTQTTSTGNYYKEPEVGTREITLTADMIYSTSAETLRSAFYKSDATLSVKMEFTSDEMIEDEVPYKLTIELPCVQVSDATANMSGMESLSQSMTFNVVDDLTNELITVALANNKQGAY